MSDNYEGRPGPPLWLGLVVMLVLPIAVFLGYGFTVVKSVDIQNLISIPNGSSTVLPPDHMYVVLAPDRGRDIGSCTVTDPTGQRATQQAPSAQQSRFQLYGRSWRAATVVITEEAGGYTVRCKQAGKRLSMIPFKASMSELKWRTLATYGFAGLSFVSGLLMIIFRRKKPKYTGLQLARAMSVGAAGPGGPPPPPPPHQYAGSERGPGAPQ